LEDSTLIYNFCAGPAMLPTEVMQQAKAEFTNWQGLGVSVMEVSHRSPEYIEMAARAEQDLRDLLNIPNNYKVLFSQGGGRGQFAAAPLNLTQLGDSVDFVQTGNWSKAALTEGERFVKANSVNALNTSNGLTSVLPESQWELSNEAKYVHYCPNETIEGVAIHSIPNLAGKTLVADMSSSILSTPLDVSQFGVVYAGAQKNIGPSGLGVVLVRDDLLGQARAETPAIFNYKVLAESDSMHNTPPTYSWYLAGLVFQWLKKQGGLSAMAKLNQEKASLLYNAVDTSDFYQNSVATNNRSIMNVPFQLADDKLNELFLSQSKAEGLLTLKGHRVVGGMRASIYNAMPIEGVQSLVNFMAEFEKRNG